ncbi:putative srpk [Lophiotrema nucula]|uniref:non-specific serine/threonine protein kinase n=1 Tax=Lophiotrema nucula TaxID=690887 RepID=A0A6A5YP20_9PLEO|nr:putative srpk [Lophiotrema nucula]
MEPSTPLSTPEPLSEYRPGGYHPVHIGDKLSNQQYTVVDKLGWGLASIAWLATDADDVCVALSITRAEDEARYRMDLMSMMQFLQNDHDEIPGKEDVLFPINSFTLEGPNGLHFCIVMPFQGQTVSKLTKRNQGADTRPLVLSSAKRAIRDLARGIGFLHKVGVVHNDLHPANLFLGVPSDQPWKLAKFREICGEPRIIEIDTTRDHHAPRYLVADAMHLPLDHSLFSGPLKIADFGEAFRTTELEPKMSAVGPYLVPELNLPNDCSTAADVWMFGCATYQLLSGFDLFGTVNDPSIKIVRGMMEVMGPPPQRIFESWKSMYGAAELATIDKPNRTLAHRVRDIKAGNETVGMKPREEEFSDTDINSIRDFLSYVLQYDPSERPTMEQCLRLAETIFRDD